MNHHEIEIKRIDRRIAILNAIGSAFGALAWAGFALELGLLTFAACQQPPAHPTTDASDAALLGDALPDGGGCAALCAHLAGIPCREGADPKCAAGCEQDVVPLPRSCWMAATTREAARACSTPTSGHLECP